MKKLLAILLSIIILAVTACSGSGGDSREWSRDGFFRTAEGDQLTIMESDMEDYPGWYVGVMFTDGTLYGWYIQQEGGRLHGNLIPEYEGAEYIVTVSEEGEDGVSLKVAGGETYHFTPSEN